MTAAINNNGGNQIDVVIGGLVVGSFDSTGLTGVKDASITAAKLAADAKPLGTGQTPQAVTRTSGVNYTSPLDRSIALSIRLATTSTCIVTIGSYTYPSVVTGSTNIAMFTLIVPPNTVYSHVSTGTVTVSELR